jgi:hypothetical protein
MAKKRKTKKPKPIKNDWDRRIERAFGILTSAQGEEAVKHLERMRGRVVNFDRLEG